jgi:hypothetical protein
MSMSITVQSAGGPEWPRPDSGPIRRPPERMDADRDRPSTAGRQTAPNPYDAAIDTLRTAALRRDAALVATSRTIEANHSTADAAIAEAAPQYRAAS